MRRLPVYIVIDVSESMAGDPIANVRRGMDDMVNTMMSDPCALETAHICVIAFAGTAKVVMLLTHVSDFRVPKLSIGSGTSLSAALTLLDREIEQNVKKNTPDSKGDWLPIVFILTDGAPTDDYRNAVAKWKAKHGSKIIPVAVLMGENSDASALASLTDRVLVFKDTSEDSYRRFFRVLSYSASIPGNLSEPDGAGKKFLDDRNIREMTKGLLADKLPTENRVEYLAIPARCVNTRKLFIARAVRRDNEKKYRFDGAFPVDESYFELSGCGEHEFTVSSTRMIGEYPPCPCCDNRHFGQCSCGKFHCLPSVDAREVKCPWCGSINNYHLAEELKLGGARD